MFSMDLRVISDQEKLLAAIRAAVATRESGRSACSHRIALPYDVAARTGRAGDVNVLLVPVNDRLERLAREWTRSPEEWMRRAGLEALRRLSKRTHPQEEQR